MSGAGVCVCVCAHAHAHTSQYRNFGLQVLWKVRKGKAGSREQGIDGKSG